SNLVTFPRGNLTQPRPEIAQSWDVSQDARTYTFHLKRGIVFSSGNPLTAEDVLYSFQRVVNLPKDPASWLITQTGIDDRNVASAVQAPDPYTVENTLQREMLGRGDADIAWDLSAAQIAAARSDARFYIVQTPDLAMEYLGMDVKNVPAFGKAEARRAVKYALDYDGIIRDLLTGN